MFILLILSKEDNVGWFQCLFFSLQSFEIIMVYFLVAILDIVHDVEAIF